MNGIGRRYLVRARSKAIPSRSDVVVVLGEDPPQVPSGAVGSRITITDRRSGAVLGVQRYVIDTANRRACGANAGAYIDPMAFISEAINR